MSPELVPAMPHPSTEFNARTNATYKSVCLTLCLVIVRLIGVLPVCLWVASAHTRSYANRYFPY